MKTLLKSFFLYIALFSGYCSSFLHSQSDTLFQPKYSIGVGYQYYEPTSTWDNHTLRLPKLRFSIAAHTKSHFKFELSASYIYLKTNDSKDESYYNIDDSKSTSSFCLGGTVAKQFFYKSFIFDAGLAGDIGYSREKYTNKTFYTYSTRWTNQKDTYFDIRMALIGNLEYRIGLNISIFASGGFGANLTHLSKEYINYFNQEYNYSFYNLIGLRYNFK